MTDLPDLRIARVDPLDLDLATADALAGVLTACDVAAGLPFPPNVGAAVLTYRQLQSDGRPLDGLWLAFEGDRLVGHLDLTLPHRENTDTAALRGHVHPQAQRRGIGRTLLDIGTRAATDAGRSRVSAGAFLGTPGCPSLEAWGFEATPGRYAVRRLDLHPARAGRWQTLYDEAAGHAADYELIHLVGPTPDELLGPMATLHEAINDAPANDADEEPALFDADRVLAYDDAMAGRRQSVYRVIARH
ncbi:MAG: GNAT family N-acetyltransferase, partial [Nocardioidaceae bacterium]|nr:GNAT family N-acetyltransferase [Nocardioidaceae bacterium]